MRIERHYTTAGQSPYAGIEFRATKSEIRNPDGSVVFSLDGIEVPATWSQVAADVLAQKYFRKAGIPARLKKVEENAIPSFLWRSVPDEAALDALPAADRKGSETKATQVFDRLARGLGLLGLEGRLFRRRGRRAGLLRRDALHAGRPDRRAQFPAMVQHGACTGPMGSTGRARAISTSITRPANSPLRNRPTSIPSPTPALSSPSPTTS